MSISHPKCRQNEHVCQQPSGRVNGMESVEAIHGHGGNTRIVWTYEDLGPRAAEMDEVQAFGGPGGARS